jgi:hypothetical protein
VKNKGTSKCSSCQSAKPSADTSADGKIKAFGFTFLRQPVFQPPPVDSGDSAATKPQEKEVVKEQTKFNPFAGLTFKTASDTNTFSFIAKTASEVDCFNGKAADAFKKSDNFKGFEGE